MCFGVLNYRLNPLGHAKASLSYVQHARCLQRHAKVSLSFNIDFCFVSVVSRRRWRLYTAKAPVHLHQRCHFINTDASSRMSHPLTTRERPRAPHHGSTYAYLQYPRVVSLNHHTISVFGDWTNCLTNGVALTLRVFHISATSTSTE